MNRWLQNPATVWKTLPKAGDILHWKHPEEDCIVFITCSVDGMENVGLYYGDVLWNNPLCMDMSGQGRWCFNHTNQEMWEVLDERPVQEEA